MNGNSFNIYKEWKTEEGKKDNEAKISKIPKI